MNYFKFYNGYDLFCPSLQKTSTRPLVKTDLEKVKGFKKCFQVNENKERTYCITLHLNTIHIIYII